MASLTSQHGTMLITLLVNIALSPIAFGAVLKEPSLAYEINEIKCIFPPANLKIPKKCSEFTLSSNVPEDFRDTDNVVFYLCSALLDSTRRLCSLVKKNVGFSARVDKALQEALPTLVVKSSLSSDEITTCKEMDILDPNTTMNQAKFMYGQMKKIHCASICIGIDEFESADREPLCKSIKFAHQQIQVAIDLQKSRNDPAAVHANPVQSKPTIKEGSEAKHQSNDMPHPSASAKPIDKDNAQQHAEKPQNVKPELSSQAEAKELNNISKTESRDVQTVAKLTHQEMAVPPPLQGAETVGSNGVDKSRLEVKPKESPNVEEGSEGDKEGNAEIKNEQSDVVDVGAAPGDSPNETQGEAQPDGPVDARGDAPGPEGTEDDTFRIGGDDDDEHGLEGNEAQELSRNEAEKLTAVEKKSSHIDVLPPVPQQKVYEEPRHKEFGGLEEEDSHFFAYFMSLSALCIFCYLIYHNKRKIIAMAVEGKKGRNTTRRRPNSASYHKLDSNLEEAMSSNSTSTNSYVIY